MINTSSLQTATTAGRFKSAYQKFLDDAADMYGKNTREYEAFKTLLDSDATRYVDAQVRHLNEMLARYSRECAEWLGCMAVSPSLPHG